LDPELTERFVLRSIVRGRPILGGAKVSRVEWDGVSQVVTDLASGETVAPKKMLCQLGRVAKRVRLEVEARG